MVPVALGVLVALGFIGGAAGYGHSQSREASVTNATTRSAGAPYEVDVTKDPGVRDGEPSLGINPRNPSNLVVGYMKPGIGECAIATTFDRGRTWRRQILPFTDGLYNACADPTLVINARGTVYFAAIAFNLTFQIGHTLVTSSRDGGRTWAKPVEAIGGDTAPFDGFDRPWLAFDDRTGTLYLTTMTIFSRPMGPLAHRYLVASRDNGRHWSEARIVDSPRYPADHWATGTITVAPNGTVAIAYTARQVPEPNRTCPCLVFATTADGRRFGHHTVPLPTGLFGIDLPAQGPVSALRLVYGPVVAAHSRRPGTYAVAAAGWDGLALYTLGQSGIVPRSRVQVHVFLTRNSGRTWSKGALLGDPSKDREHVWLDYSAKGVLGAVWRTHIDSCCLGSTEVWAVVSRDGGNTFGRPRRVSREPSPWTGGLGDDFQSVVLDGTFLHAAWGDARNGNGDVYYARLPL